MQSQVPPTLAQLAVDAATAPDVPETDTILGAAQQDPAAMTEAQAARHVEETFNPALVRHELPIGDRSIKMTNIPWGAEQEIIDILAWYLRTITDASAVGLLEDTLGALLIEASADLEKICLIILEHHWGEEPQFAPQPEQRDAEGTLVAPAMTTRDRLRAWLKKKAHFEQIADLVLTQIKRNKLADSLGKLWAPGVLGVKALKALNTLPHHLQQLLLAKSMESPAGTESTQAPS